MSSKLWYAYTALNDLMAFVVQISSSGNTYLSLLVTKLVVDETQVASRCQAQQYFGPQWQDWRSI